MRSVPKCVHLTCTKSWTGSLYPSVCPSLRGLRLGRIIFGHPRAQKNPHRMDGGHRKKNLSSLFFLFLGPGLGPILRRHQERCLPVFHNFAGYHAFCNVVSTGHIIHHI